MVDFNNLRTICKPKVDASVQCYERNIKEVIEPKLQKAGIFRLIPKEVETLYELLRFLAEGKSGKFLRNNHDKVLQDALTFLSEEGSDCEIKKINEYGEEAVPIYQECDEYGDCDSQYASAVYDCEELLGDKRVLDLYLEMFKRNGIDISHIDEL